MGVVVYWFGSFCFLFLEGSCYVRRSSSLKLLYCAKFKFGGEGLEDVILREEVGVVFRVSSFLLRRELFWLFSSDEFSDDCRFSY